MLRAARLLSLALALLSACGPETRRPETNVLLISIDTLRADRLGAYGYDRPTSPAIDSLAAGGVLFERAQSSSSWTLPGLASIHTSLYTSTTGCWTFEDTLGPSFRTLAEVLRDGGYDTAGVASHVFLGSNYGLHQGFTHYDQKLVVSTNESHAQITSPEVSASGIEFLENKAAVPAEGPWFLWLHYFDPHYVFHPHEGISEAFGTKNNTDLYDGEIAFTDRYVGQVLSALDRLDLTDETIVILVADHGEEFGDHQDDGHGKTLYREVMRVPMILRAPGIDPARVESVVRTVDLFPTILHLVGLESDRALDGRSLVPMLTGGDALEATAMAELRLNTNLPFDSLAEERFKLIVDRTSDEARLFDFRLDPSEKRDVASKHPELVARMRQDLESWIERARAESENYEPSIGVSLLPGERVQLEDLGYADEGDDR